MNEHLVIKALQGWNTLHEVIGQLSEDELHAALQIEQRNQRRKTIMTRLHQRYCSKRKARERKELLEDAT